MKTTLLTVALITSLSAFSQTKLPATTKRIEAVKDTTISITLKLEEYKQLLYTLDGLIDSKKASKEIIDFIQKRATVINDKKN